MESDSIDDVILSIAESNGRSMKVAMLIAKVTTTLDGSIPDDNRAQRIAGRIEALVKDGCLEGFGNLTRWRHSEVKFLAR